MPWNFRSDAGIEITNGGFLAKAGERHREACRLVRGKDDHAHAALDAVPVASEHTRMPTWISRALLAGCSVRAFGDENRRRATARVDTFSHEGGTDLAVARTVAASVDTGLGIAYLQ